jgi:Helix-turn-helix domain
VSDDITRRRTLAREMNEIRGRFISALRRHSLTGAELRVAIALNDLYNPKRGKAWPTQDSLREVTGVSLRSVERAVAGLKRKGIFLTRTVWLSYSKSRLEYYPNYNKIIACDPGYHKRLKRDPAAVMPALPAKDGEPTRQRLSPYPPKMVELPAKSGGLSSLVSSLEPSLEPSIEDKGTFNEEGKGKGTSEVESKGQRSLREYQERLAARRKGRG